MNYLVISPNGNHSEYVVSIIGERFTQMKKEGYTFYALIPQLIENPKTE